MILKFLIEKEFKQLVRNKFLPKLILFMPCMMMLVLPWAATMEVRDVQVVVVDNDHSPVSERLVRKIEASSYFHFVASAETYDQAETLVEKGQADIVVQIPLNFEQDLTKTGRADVLISANAVNGTKGGLGSGYLTRILADYSDELNGQRDVVSMPVVHVEPKNQFNPYQNYKLYMIPALVVMLLTMLCGFLPALNIVSEKEAGTIEQINVTPVGKFTFILSKLIPYWVIGFVVLTLCFALVGLVYGIFPVGHWAAIYLAAVFFVLTISGLGLVISNHSGTMQQAMFVMYFFVIILMLMSGLFTPVFSMPDWAQTIAMFNPLKYFVQIMRAVYLKGCDLPDLVTPLSALVGFALFFNLWAVISYRKSN